MSPTARYNSNLKVLRRRDPSIVSIFDQFSHVCVYHYVGNKWEKQGFEGSMFLYERLVVDLALQVLTASRNQYPPYGFYILNRMGTEDYSQRLYPEDDIGAHGSYLMLRSYPDFTANRIQTVNRRYGNPDVFADAYAVDPDIPREVKENIGPGNTIGLWMFATDARGPMIDIMVRLYSFIKKNQPYPAEFRYGPDKPLPPKQSEIDQLFAKLTTPNPLPPSNKLTVESLFAQIKGGAQTQDTIQKSPPTPIIHSPQPTTTALPQILNQDVISTLLGLPPSRSSSAAMSSPDHFLRRKPSAYSSSREGDNEEDEDTDYPSTALDEDDDEEEPAACRPTVISGDATPRAPHNFLSPPRDKPVPPKPKPNSRPLVPFQPESTDLWPYPPNSNHVDTDDIPELDFADTRALGQLANGVNGRQKKEKGKKKADVQWDTPAPPSKSTPAVDEALVRQTVISTVAVAATPQQRTQMALGRREFVTEVLTLFHVRLASSVLCGLTKFRRTRVLWIDCGRIT